MRHAECVDLFVSCSYKIVLILSPLDLYFRFSSTRKKSVERKLTSFWINILHKHLWALSWGRKIREVFRSSNKKQVIWSTRLYLSQKNKACETLCGLAQYSRSLDGCERGLSSEWFPRLIWKVAFRNSVNDKSMAIFMALSVYLLQLSPWKERNVWPKRTVSHFCVSIQKWDGYLALKILVAVRVFMSFIREGQQLFK